jgi:hypothetical protein
MADTGVNRKIKINFKEIWCETVDWVQSTHDSRESPTVSSCEHGNKPSGSIQNSDLFDQLSDNTFNKSTLLSEISCVPNMAYWELTCLLETLHMKPEKYTQRKSMVCFLPNTVARVFRLCMHNNFSALGVTCGRNWNISSGPSK